MAVKHIKFNLFLSLCIYLFIFFLFYLLTFENDWIAIGFSPRVIATVTFLSLLLSLHSNFSEYLIDNLTNSFHIIKQRFDFLLPRRQRPLQSFRMQLFGKFHFVRKTPSTGNSKEVFNCLSALIEKIAKRDPVQRKASLQLQHTRNRLYSMTTILRIEKRKWQARCLLLACVAEGQIHNGSYE
jgi:hypothetical protein